MTNGFAEGITNKIKVMKRMSYGFRNSERYQRKVLLMSARPPKPETYPPKFVKSPKLATGQLKALMRTWTWWREFGCPVLNSSSRVRRAKELRSQRRTGVSSR